jgi:predicted nucleic acid-binding protein
VIDLVIDASVLLKWFRTEGEGRLEEAHALRSAFASGRVVVHAPPFLRLEILNVAGRRWGWDESRLTDLATSLEELGIEYTEPDVRGVGRWTAGGLTAYDAAYVALAEQEAIRLVTDDDLILELAPGIATSLLTAPELFPSVQGSDDRAT